MKMKDVTGGSIIPPKRGEDELMRDFGDTQYQDLGM